MDFREKIIDQLRAFSLYPSPLRTKDPQVYNVHRVVLHNSFLIKH